MTVPQKVNAADRSPVQQQQDDEQPTAADGNRQFGPRSYQQDLIELATDNNVSMSRASADGVECLLVPVPTVHCLQVHAVRAGLALHTTSMTLVHVMARTFLAA